MRLIVRPASAGGAVLLYFQVQEDKLPLIVATGSATPPSTPLTSGRRVVNPDQRLHPTSNPVAILTTGDWYQVLDTDRTLRSGLVYYHLFAMDSSSVVSSTAHITQSADARASFVKSHVPIIRDFVRSRLEYHFDRAILDGLVQPALNNIPVLERKSLARDEPLPCCTIQEYWSPDGESSIGHGNTFSGDKREKRRVYRVRIDLMVLSENPNQRTVLGAYLHECLEQDFELFSLAGYRIAQPQRSSQDAIQESGDVLYGEEINIDGTVEVYTLHDLRYTATDNLAELKTEL